MLTKPEDWICFFPEGTRVVAIPNWRRPRLLLPFKEPLHTASLLSRFFSVHSRGARIYKSLLKAWVALGGGLPVRLNDKYCCIEPFVRNTGVEFNDVIVIVGRPSPIQKIKIVILNNCDVVGFIKYGEKKLAQRRVQHEFEVLKALPAGLAPVAVKIDKVMKGSGLLLSPIGGKPVTAQLPPGDEILEFQQRLVVQRNVMLDEHPWVLELRRAGIPAGEWLDPLYKRDWDIVIQHGDFVPWNLLRDASGRIVAVDWEFSNLKGFPFLDIAYYILQYGALVKRWNPKFAFIYTRYFLNERFSLDLEIADSLVRLAAFDAYRVTAQNGRDDNWPLQRWRRAVWEVEC